MTENLDASLSISWLMMCTSVLVVFGVAGRARRGVESMTHNAANDVISG